MTEAGGNYRDETRLVHMLQVLERLSGEAEEISVVGDLSDDDRLTRATMYDFIVLGEAANNGSSAEMIGNRKLRHPMWNNMGRP
jgi:uncharacterized protein with HEPN domain